MYIDQNVEKRGPSSRLRRAWSSTSVLAVSCCLLIVQFLAPHAACLSSNSLHFMRPAYCPTPCILLSRTGLRQAANAVTGSFFSLWFLWVRWPLNAKKHYQVTLILILLMAYKYTSVNSSQWYHTCCINIMFFCPRALSARG